MYCLFFVLFCLFSTILGGSEINYWWLLYFHQWQVIKLCGIISDGSLESTAGLYPHHRTTYFTVFPLLLCWTIQLTVRSVSSMGSLWIWSIRCGRRHIFICPWLRFSVWGVCEAVYSDYVWNFVVIDGIRTFLDAYYVKRSRCLWLEFFILFFPTGSTVISGVEQSGSFSIKRITAFCAGGRFSFLTVIVLFVARLELTHLGAYLGSLRKDTCMYYILRHLQHFRVSLAIGTVAVRSSDGPRRWQLQSKLYINSFVLRWIWVLEA